MELYDKYYLRFHDIKPRVHTLATEMLLENSLPVSESSQWLLLKASALFRMDHKRPFSWLIAGKQLMTLKVLYSDSGYPPAVIPS